MDQKDLIVNKIKLLKQVHPREEWKVSNRVFLLAKIENEYFVEPDKKQQKAVSSSLIRDIRLPLHNFHTEKISDFQFQDPQRPFMDRLRAIFFLRALARPITAVILFFTVACGAFAAVGIKSQESIPGDALYPVKIAIEKAEIFLTTRDKKAELHTNLAKRRLDEASKIAKIDEPAPVKKKEKIEKTIEVFKKEVKTAKVYLAEPIVDDNSEKAAAIAKNIESKTDEFEKVLKDIPEALPKEIKSDIKDSVDEALDASEEVGDKALEVMVENMDGISEEEVLAKITQEIQKTEAKIAKVEVKAEEVKQGKIRKTGEDQEGDKTRDKENEEIKKTDEEVFEIKEILSVLIVKTAEAEEEKAKEKMDELNQLNPENGGDKEDINKVEEDVTASDDEILSKALEDLKEAKSLLEKAKKYLKEKDFKTALKLISTSKELVKKAEAVIENLSFDESSNESEPQNGDNAEEVKGNENAGEDFLDRGHPDEPPSNEEDLGESENVPEAPDNLLETD